ncbi:hypothetical protein N0V93_001303 [Gnomoniopsis smithogilvyi]|uniref:Uncharacterized protein n=1 Tax=Gnomoniopsis smithogilvyi TaxID=1191159 RepID=A0A9W8Z5A2_9PEZI|nr:hypothetical protein N0V93_001303 [Gnomoniopsis smithogilvyi]
MAPRKSVAADDSSSEDEINVDQMIKTKDELKKIRKDREEKRAQLQKDLEMKLLDLRRRIKQTVEAHTQQLGDINKQQVDRLAQALEARDSIDRMIQEKLVNLQREANFLVALLDSGYEYRIQKARSLVTPVSEQELDQGEGRPVKKVKIGTSSS